MKDYIVQIRRLPPAVLIIWLFCVYQVVRLGIGWISSPPWAFVGPLWAVFMHTALLPFFLVQVAFIPARTNWIIVIAAIQVVCGSLVSIFTFGSVISFIYTHLVSPPLTDDTSLHYYWILSALLLISELGKLALLFRYRTSRSLA